MLGSLEPFLSWCTMKQAEHTVYLGAAFLVLMETWIISRNKCNASREKVQVGFLGARRQGRIRHSFAVGERGALRHCWKGIRWFNPCKGTAGKTCQNYRCKYPLRQQSCFWKSILQTPQHAYKWQMYKIIHWGILCNGKRLETSQEVLSEGLVSVLWHPPRGRDSKDL